MSEEKPQLVYQEPDADIAPFQQTCSQFHGVDICPSRHLAIATNGANVRLVLMADRAALFVDHTPQGARQFAQQLIRAADHLEAIQGAQADGMIQQWLAGRGQA
jgi:hypothetical protein